MFHPLARAALPRARAFRALSHGLRGITRAQVIVDAGLPAEAGVVCSENDSLQKKRLSDLTPWIHYNNLQAGEVCLLVTSSLNDRWMWSLWCGELSGSKVFKFKWVESASM